MLSTYAVLSSLIVTVSTSQNLEFPADFKFGAATSSYQIEGAWNADGKGESIWDRLSHSHPSLVEGNATGDVAADSYHRWREDVKIVADLGLHFYRFSISWPRILPTGFPNKINNAGVKYYSDLIDALLAAGVEPVVTLYHWELPVKIQDLGGWTNPMIVTWFEDYVRVIFSLYADRVKTWITINEAITICDFSYNLASYAPAIIEREFGALLCTKFILLAHAKAYHIYDQEYRNKYFGSVSWANVLVWVKPATPDVEMLAEQVNQLVTGRYSHPIFSQAGGWPPSIEEMMLEDSLKKGYNQSRLPSFTEEEKNLIKGSSDYYGINYYTTYYVRRTKPGEKPYLFFSSGPDDLDVILYPRPNSTYGALSILPVYPKGLRQQLLWLKRHYGNLQYFIYENGFSTKTDRLVDNDRVSFIQEHLKQVLLSIHKDNIRIIGYTVWSLIDNFEWLDGYKSKFGLYKVDFRDPNRTRTPRASAKFYQCVIAGKSLGNCHINITIQDDNAAYLIKSKLCFTIIMLIIQTLQYIYE